MQKHKTGITLISLIVTIIVLIILAGVSINAVFSDNGIIKKAQEAQNKMNEAVQKDMEDINKLTNLLDSYMNGTGSNGGSSGENNNTTETKANAPKLSTGMIPVKFDTSKTENGNNGEWVICSSTDSDWYSYTETDKKWANVMLCDGTYNESTEVGTVVKEEDLGSMFVWIPRFAYTITSGYHETNGSIDVVWLSDTTYNYIDSTGTTCTAKNGNEDGVTTNNAGYYVAHPAFTNGNTYSAFDNGEWKSEITGIWVAKFQAGFATTENDTTQKVTIASSSTDSTTATTVYYPIFKGRKFAYNYVTASQCYDLSQSLDDSGNPYGLTSASNSHLMKNSEWGAVAYLSISKYGYSGGTATEETEKSKNNLSVVAYSNYANSPVSNPNNSSWKVTAITGYSATSGKEAANVMTYKDTTSLTDSVTGTNGTSYAWNYVSNGSNSGSGTKSSTTGNIYGVYDMGGCLSDYTSSYIYKEGVDYLTTYGGSFSTGTSTYLATAYPYQKDTSVTYFRDTGNISSAYPGWSKIYGDGIWEMSYGTEESGITWFEQEIEWDTDNNNLYLALGGGWYSLLEVGVCGFFDSNGGVNWTNGFHSVLVVE